MRPRTITTLTALALAAATLTGCSPQDDQTCQPTPAKPSASHAAYLKGGGGGGGGGHASGGGAKGGTSSGSKAGTGKSGTTGGGTGTGSRPLAPGPYTSPPRYDTAPLLPGHTSYPYWMHQTRTPARTCS